MVFNKYPRTVCARPRAGVEPAAASAPPLGLRWVLVLVLLSFLVLLSLLWRSNLSPQGGWVGAAIDKY